MKLYERTYFLAFHKKNWKKYLVTLTVCKLWGGLCIIFTGQVASKADEFRLNGQKSPKARAHSGERAPKLKVKLTTQFRQPHLSALIAHSRLEFSLNHLVLFSNTYIHIWLITNIFSWGGKLRKCWKNVNLREFRLSGLDTKISQYTYKITV